MKLTPITEALSEVGLITRPTSIEKGAKISDYLNNQGASLPEIASQLSLLVNSSQDDSIKLRASELALKCHGALEKSEQKTIPQIIFIGADNATFNVLIPR